MEGTEVIEGLDERIEGRYAKKTIYHPETGEVILERDDINHRRCSTCNYGCRTLKK